MSVIIVGNAAIWDSRLAEIDSAQKIVRFNNCKNLDTTGLKTSVLCLTNYARPPLELNPAELWLWHDVKIPANWYPCVPRTNEYESLRNEVIEILKRFGGKDKMPSSGILALTKLIKTEQNISLMGFTWQGWNGHDFTAEQKYCKYLQAEDRIKIL